MGEGDNKKKNGGDGGGNKKKEDQSPINVVLKVHMHCEGCANKIIKCLRRFDGVETVKAEWEKSKVTVVGKVDPMKVRDKLAKRTKKEIELVSPLPSKKDKDGGDKKSEAKTEQKIKEPPVTTAVLKINVHCRGCFEKIHRLAAKFEGVYTVSIDGDKDLVTVKGTMDAKALQGTLKEKMKRSVDIVPPKKEKEKDGGGGGNAGGGGGGGQKQKGKGGGGDGGKKKDEDGDGGGGREGGGGDKAELNRMDFYGGYGYIVGPGYFVEPVYPPQLFSDENPNACNIM